MAEEKVGFGFEFGIKGEKEVQKGLQDIIALMGNANSAASAIGGALSRAGGLIELGAMAAPFALVAAAVGVFAYKSNVAGENLRVLRYEFDRLSKVPVSGLSLGDLSENQSAMLSQYSRLGLEAGNTFKLSLMDRLKNWGEGAHAVGYDMFASFMNIFGAKMQSYEQSSPEAKEFEKRVMEEEKRKTAFVSSQERQQQAMAAIRRKTSLESIELYSLNYGAKPGQPGTGVMPESFMGRQRQMEIERQQLAWSMPVAGQRADFLVKQLEALKESPLPLLPGAAPELQQAATAKRTEDIRDLESQINEEKAKQLEAAKGILEIDLQQRQIQRDFIHAQNYGSWRAVGGGGHTTIDPRMFAMIKSGAIGQAPSDVGYTATGRPPVTESGTPQSASAQMANALLKSRDAVVKFGDAVGDVVKKIMGAVIGKDAADAVSKFHDSIMKPEITPEGMQNVPKRTQEAIKKYQQQNPSSVPPGGVQYFDRNGKPVSLPSMSSNLNGRASGDYFGASQHSTVGEHLINGMAHVVKAVQRIGTPTLTS